MKKADEILNCFAGQSNEFTLFSLVEQLGELLSGDIHVIDDTDRYAEEGEQSFRVYHAKGFCFEIKKTAEVNEETGEFENWDFRFYSEWDGFGKCDVKKAIELVTEYSKT